MIGVVLWSDTVDRKAVILCEDAGDLAFLCDKTATFEDPFFEVGDVVRFEIELRGTLRFACQPEMVHRERGRQLARAFQPSEDQQKRRRSRETARIIPLYPDHRTPPAAPFRTKQTG